MNDQAAGAQPLAVKEADAPQDGWDDPVRGRLRWRTLFSQGLTPTSGMTCGVTELGRGDWLGLHRHAPPEIYYVFAGAGIVSLDGREINVSAGSAVFIPGMAEHGIRQTGDDLLRLFYGFPVELIRQRRIFVHRGAARVRARVCSNLRMRLVERPYVLKPHQPVHPGEAEDGRARAFAPGSPCARRTKLTAAQDQIMVLGPKRAESIAAQGRKPHDHRQALN